MDWGLTASLGSFVLCLLSLEFIWPVPSGIWRWTWKLWRQWRWMVGTCTNIILTLPVPAWHACDISISSQRDENTVEDQIVKLRSVVQLCNLEAVGFQWMVAKIVYQVVESVPSLWELTHTLKLPIVGGIGESTTMNQCCESVTIVVVYARFLHHPLQGGCDFTYSAWKKNRDTITRCVCFWLAATDCLIAFVTLHMYGVSIS